MATIRLPMLKARVGAAGLFPADLETAIAAALTKEEVLVDPIVTVSVVEYRSRPISVMGAVKTPLTFQATGVVTLLDAISRAGGLAENAGPEILVSRPQLDPDGPRHHTGAAHSGSRPGLNNADPALNVRLEGGEEIRVPEAGRIFVVGNVKQPGAFLIQDGAESSVLKALALSQGLLPYRQQDGLYLPDRGRRGRQERNPHRTEEHHGPQVARRAAAGQRHHLHPGQHGPAEHHDHHSKRRFSLPAAWAPRLFTHSHAKRAIHARTNKISRASVRFVRKPACSRLSIWPFRPQQSNDIETPTVPLSHYLWVLRRQAWKIAAFVVTCVLATLVISSRLEPIYESTASVDMDRQAPSARSSARIRRVRQHLTIPTSFSRPRSS